MKLSTMVSNSENYEAPTNELEIEATVDIDIETNIDNTEIPEQENKYERNDLSVEDLQQIAGISQEPIQNDNSADLMPEQPSEAEQAELDYMKSLSGM